MNESTDPSAVPPETPMPPPVAPPRAPPTGPGQEERQWAMFAHLSALIGGLLTCAMGCWGMFIGPLVIWLVKKDTMAFVNDQGKEALNFNITVAVAFVCLFVLSIGSLFLLLPLTFPAGIVLGVAWLVLTIIAAIKANEGETYRYPVNWRVIK